MANLGMYLGFRKPTTRSERVRKRAFYWTTRTAILAGVLGTRFGRRRILGYIGQHPHLRRVTSPTLRYTRRFRLPGRRAAILARRKTPLSARRKPR